MDLNVVVVRNQENAFLRDVDAANAFARVVFDDFFESMVVLTLVHGKVGLATLVSDAHLVYRVDDQRDAPHEVIHNRLELRNIGGILGLVVLERVEVNESVRDNLDVFAVAHAYDEALDVQFMVPDPL